MGVIPAKFGVMAVDPGGTSGVAQALLNGRRANSTRQLLSRAVAKKAFKVAQVGGTPSEQAARLQEIWERFEFHCTVERGIPANHVYLVIESFQLRQRSADLAPVKIIERFEERLEREIEKQSASQAMTYATNERLRAWNVWAVGKEHGRDAIRHLALKASKVLDGR